MTAFWSLAHAHAGRAEQRGDLVDQAELAGHRLVDDQVHAVQPEPGGRAVADRLAGRARQLIGSAGLEPEPLRGRGRGDELAAAQRGPERLVRGGAQRHPGPERGRVHADDVDRAAARGDLGAVEGNRVAHAGDLAEPGDVAAGQAAGRDDQQVGQDDPAERPGLGRAGALVGGLAGTARPGTGLGAAGRHRDPGRVLRRQPAVRVGRASLIVERQLAGQAEPADADDGGDRQHGGVLGPARTGQPGVQAPQPLQRGGRGLDDSG